MYVICAFLQTEIGRRSAGDNVLEREGYAVSAGFALGLVALGMNSYVLISIVLRHGHNSGFLMKVVEKMLLVSWTQWLINCSIILVEKKFTMYAVESIILSLLCVIFQLCIICTPNVLHKNCVLPFIKFVVILT